MNDLFRRSKAVQWGAALSLAMTYGAAWAWVAWHLAWPVVVLLLPVAFSHFMFAMTPLLRLTGVFVYHSPMLRSFLPRRTLCDLHTGTFFDYLMHFRWEERGPAASRRLLGYFVEGLVAISEDIRAGRISPDVRIQVTSYFIKEDTFVRYGFRTGAPDFAYRLNSFVSYFNLVLMYSYARGRLTFPALSLARRAEMSGKELLRHAPAMAALARKLGRPSTLTTAKPPAETVSRSPSIAGGKTD